MKTHLDDKCILRQSGPLRGFISLTSRKSEPLCLIERVGD